MRRLLPLVIALAGCVLLAVSEFARLVQIKAITAPLYETTVGSHNAYSLLIIAIAAALMAFGALVGGSRPAAFALLALAAAALIVVLAVDLPDVGDTGTYGRDYEQVKATAGSGFYLETLGAALLAVAAVASVLLPAPGRNDPAA